MYVHVLHLFRHKNQLGIFNGCLHELCGIESYVHALSLLFGQNNMEASVKIDKV